MYSIKNSDDFKFQIKDELKGLNCKQIIFFSWLCAVRAFPFLSASGAIEYWPEKLKMKYLYNILRSLDITSAAIDSIRIVTATDAATAAIIADEVDSAFTNTNNGAMLAVKIAAGAVYAAYIAFADANIPNINICAEAACDVVTDVAVNTYTAATYYNVNLSDILLDDIKQIKEDKYSSFHHDINLYGPIWDNFQNTFCALGCEYWSMLYANIFESGFMIYVEALERRINIPFEIQEQGAKAAGLYLEKLDLHGGEHLNEARIIILGEKGAGKTCLSRRLKDINAPMTAKDESTEGVATTIWKINSNKDNSSVNAHIWDFAGHVITHAAHRCFLSERCLYIIVYDGRTEERNRLNYWLEHVKNYGGGAPVRILINMFDNHKPDIPENTLKEKYPYIIDFIYLSIDNDTDELKKFCDKTSEFIQTNPLWNCLDIPSTYYKVKESLEKRFQKDSAFFYNEHISKDIFDQIAQKSNIEGDSAEQLLNDLHELGICLWYHDIDEFNTLVLNPDWISHGIYGLINWAHNNSKYIVSIDDRELIFKDEKARYPIDKLLFLFKLMKRYELAYSKESDSVITIPFLLKEDQPDNLPYFGVEDSLLIQYVSDQPLPPNTVSRLIVRHNKNIRNSNEVWRHGVVLRYKENTIVMVKEDDRKIIIKAKGNNSGEYIAELRNTMDDIFNSYKGDKPELQYKIITNKPVVTSPFGNDENKQLMLSDEIIKSCISNGHPNYYYPQANIDIPLNQTMNIYHINSTNAVFGSNAQITSYNINFSDCNLALQGELKSLISSLNLNGYTNEAADLETTISDLEKAENIDTKKEVIKSGRMVKIKNFLEDINNEKSSMRKIISGIKYGVKTAQSIAKTYNDIAQWAGLPQVPKPFLGES